MTVGSSTTTPAMTIEGSMGGTLIVHNTGTIIGAGGAGSANGTEVGYNAVKADQNGNITFYNNSGGSILGGGGGGGGGKGGTGGKGGQGGRGGQEVNILNKLEPWTGLASWWLHTLD